MITTPKTDGVRPTSRCLERPLERSPVAVRQTSNSLVEYRTFPEMRALHAEKQAMTQITIRRLDPPLHRKAGAAVAQRQAMTDKLDNSEDAS